MLPLYPYIRNGESVALMQNVQKIKYQYTYEFSIKFFAFTDNLGIVYVTLFITGLEL
jgi:hypothetical protein